MNDHKQLITTFYSALNKADYKTMQECYHDAVIFFDPIFEDLNAVEVRDMWEMLCRNATDFSVEFSDVGADEEYGSCLWVARYTFSQTGKKVTNKVRAYFKFHEGKIVEHTDNFDVWVWSRQALGLPGWILGWSNLLQKKVRERAQNNLANFMQAKAARKI